MQGIKRSQVSNKRDILKWKKKKRTYRKRWMADETIFSSIKRTYGEYICISAIKYQNMIKEMILKVSFYNLFRRMA